MQRLFFIANTHTHTHHTYTETYQVNINAIVIAEKKHLQNSSCNWQLKLSCWRETHNASWQFVLSTLERFFTFDS